MWYDYNQMLIITIEILIANAAGIPKNNTFFYYILIFLLIGVVKPNRLYTTTISKLLSIV